MVLTGKIDRMDACSTSEAAGKPDVVGQRNFVLAIQDRNDTQYVELCLVGENTSLLDGFKVGDAVTVDILIQGDLRRGNDGEEYCTMDIEAVGIAAGPITSQIATKA